MRKQWVRPFPIKVWIGNFFHKQKKYLNVPTAINESNALRK